MEAARKRGMGVLVKHNMEDGFKRGIQVPESIEIAKQIESFGVAGIVLSSCFVSKVPMAVMRGRIYKDYGLLHGLERVATEDCGVALWPVAYQAV